MASVTSVRGFEQLHRPVLRHRLELAAEQRLAAREPQLPVDVVPFERPHQRPRPWRSRPLTRECGILKHKRLYL